MSWRRSPDRFEETLLGLLIVLFPIGPLLVLWAAFDDFGWAGIAWFVVGMGLVVPLCRLLARLGRSRLAHWAERNLIDRQFHNEFCARCGADDG